MLRADDPKGTTLSRSESGSDVVGTQCYYLAVSTGFGRVLNGDAIVGQNSFPQAGTRLNLETSPERGAVGSALLDEYGDVVGMVGASLVPGADVIESYLMAASPSRAGGNIVRDGLALPIASVPATFDAVTPATLDELKQKGEMIQPLTAPDMVQFGELVLMLEKGQGALSPRDSRRQFSHRDGTVHVYVNWDPRTRFKGTGSMVVYDADNHSVVSSKPLKLNLHQGDLSAGIWDIPLVLLPVGYYRVDVSLGDDLVWRRFFRLTE